MRDVPLAMAIWMVAITGCVVMLWMMLRVERANRERIKACIAALEREHEHARRCLDALEETTKRNSS